MTQEKMGKVITACVSAGTVLLVCLLSFLIYQWIAIAVYDKKIDKVTKEIEVLEMELVEAEDTAEEYEKNFWLQWKLDELGIIKDKN